MELKTFLLPLRLGLLTAFHPSTEVNIFTKFSLHLLPLRLFLTGVETVKRLVYLTGRLQKIKYALEARSSRH